MNIAEFTDLTPIATLIAREQNRLIDEWARTELPKFIPGIEAYLTPFDLEKVQDLLLEHNISMHHIIPANRTERDFYCIMQGMRIVSRFDVRLAGSYWPEPPTAEQVDGLVPRE